MTARRGAALVALVFSVALIGLGAFTRMASAAATTPWGVSGYQYTGTGPYTASWAVAGPSGAVFFLYVHCASAADPAMAWPPARAWQMPWDGTNVRASNGACASVVGAEIYQRASTGVVTSVYYAGGGTPDPVAAGAHNGQTVALPAGFTVAPDPNATPTPTPTATTAAPTPTPTATTAAPTPTPTATTSSPTPTATATLPPGGSGGTASPTPTDSPVPSPSLADYSYDELNEMKSMHGDLVMGLGLMLLVCTATLVVSVKAGRN